MPDRRETCLRLSTRLALMDDGALRRLCRAAAPTHGWGRNRRVQVDGTPVFVKSVPVTDRELAHRYSTRNRYRLPCYYNYGVGSAGFGAFRELAAHVKTTHWVLSGAVEGFPLMYHHRILPRLDRPQAADPDGLERYVRRWNSSPSIRRYMEDRRTARHEIVLFLEWVPHALFDRLVEDPSLAAPALAAMRHTLDFAAERGLLHFDAHARNILTDGQAFYLTDFGLALDAEFDLTARERAFLARHRHYDHGECALMLLIPLVEAARRAPDAERRAFVERYGGDDPSTVLAALERIVADDPLGLDPTYLRLAQAYREVMVFMHRFFRALRPNPRKDTRYDDDALAALLHAPALTDGGFRPAE